MHLLLLLKQNSIIPFWKFICDAHVFLELHISDLDNTVKLGLCSETTLTGETWFHRSTPMRIERGSLMTGSKGLTHWTSETVCECSEITGSRQASPQQPRLWSWKEDLQRAWNQDRRAVWDQVGLSHCRYNSLVMVDPLDQWDCAWMQWGCRLSTITSFNNNKNINNFLNQQFRFRKFVIL